ncbi:MAG TPA: hypothetical protein DEH25_17435 [Chloroflexi bacterium]|nr:hypothetical protein [Chloroflexota bacterium]
MTNSYHRLIDEINAALNKRAASYPLRDQSYANLVEIIEQLSSFLLENTRFDEFAPQFVLPDDVYFLNALYSFSAHPIFICGSMKSGTSLLTQLLDGHPALFVMPSDSHYVNQKRKWQREEFSEIARYWLNRMINPSGKEPFWFLGPERAKLESFLQILRYLLRNTCLDVFVCVMLASCSVSKDVNELPRLQYWVEKTPGNESAALDLANQYPRAKFIHILRDPLENIASLKKLAALRKNPFYAVNYAVALKRSFHLATENQRVLGESRYMVVRYEDLVSLPRQIMEDITRFLGIAYNESLLTPTENDRLAGSNSMFADRRVTGQIVNQSHDDRYKLILDQRELREIVTILYDDAVKRGYPWQSKNIVGYRKGWIYHLFLQGYRVWNATRIRFLGAMRFIAHRKH